MRKLLAILVIILIGCGSTRQAAGPADPIARTLTKAELVEHTGLSTVALEHLDAESSQMRAYCTGVFVTETDILTAAHCIVDPEEPLGEKNPFNENYMYSVQHDMGELWHSPTATHNSKLVRIDLYHDLALLRVVGEAPSHRVAVIADSAGILDKLILVGHPSGHTYTYMEGTVSAIRYDLPKMKKLGPWLQVNASIWRGNSGGGAFNEYGELVGIASFLTNAAPNCAMYIHRDTIAAFLASKKLVVSKDDK